MKYFKTIIFPLFVLVFSPLLILICGTNNLQTGKWSTHIQNSTQENTWLVFRFGFEVSNINEELPVHYAVDSKYCLYINDELDIFEGGLKRGFIRNKTYCDLASYVKNGKNKIEVYGGGFHNHGWSGWPLTIAGEYLAGITRGDEGYKKILVKPRLEEFNSLSFQTPIREALLGMEYIRGG